MVPLVQINGTFELMVDPRWAAGVLPKKGGVGEEEKKVGKREAGRHYLNKRFKEGRKRENSGKKYTLIARIEFWNTTCPYASDAASLTPTRGSPLNSVVGQYFGSPSPLCRPDPLLLY